jgi:hypothetical protein
MKTQNSSPRPCSGRGRSSMDEASNRSSSITASARGQARLVGIGMMALPPRWMEWCCPDWFDLHHLERYLAIEQRALAQKYSARRAAYAELLANEIKRRKALWRKKQ